MTSCTITNGAGMIGATQGKLQAEKKFCKNLPEIFALLSCPDDLLTRQCLLECSSSRVNFAIYIFVMLGLNHSQRLTNQVFAEVVDDTGNFGMVFVSRDCSASCSTDVYLLRSQA